MPLTEDRPEYRRAARVIFSSFPKPCLSFAGDLLIIAHGEPSTKNSGARSQEAGGKKNCSSILSCLLDSNSCLLSPKTLRLRKMRRNIIIDRLAALTLFYYHQRKIGYLLAPEFLRILADYLILHAASRNERGPLLYSQLLECVQYLF